MFFCSPFTKLLKKSPFSKDKTIRYYLLSIFYSIFSSSVNRIHLKLFSILCDRNFSFYTHLPTHTVHFLLKQPPNDLSSTVLSEICHALNFNASYKWQIQFDICLIKLEEKLTISAAKQRQNLHSQDIRKY